MAREVSMEVRACQKLEQLGCRVLKVGWDGWPDRLVLWAPGQHFWLEFKTPQGRPTRAQKGRIGQLRAGGEPVYFVVDMLGVLAAYQAATGRIAA